MSRPSGSFGLVGDFELRIIPRRVENYTHAAHRQHAVHWKRVKVQTGMSVPPETCWAGPFLNSPLSLKYIVLYAAPIALRCWKHSRQNTGRPCVGRKGTVVSFPHCEQFVFVSERIGEACTPPPPPPSARFALQALHLFGSFLKPLSAKNICSPAVKTNSALHSEHFSTLSWYSMSRSPLVPCGAGDWADFVPESLDA